METSGDLALSNAVARVDRPALTDYVVSQQPTEKKASSKVATNR